MSEHTEHETDEGHSGDHTETIEVELDPARSQMYRMAKEEGGELIDAFLDDQVRDAVTQAYDNRQQFGEQYEQQQQAIQQQASPEPDTADGD